MPGPLGSGQACLLWAPGEVLMSSALERQPTFHSNEMLRDAEVLCCMHFAQVSKEVES